jgi:hypothetical protein
VLEMMSTSISFYSLVAFYPNLIVRGELWRLVTWVFVPPLGSGVIGTAIMLYFTYFIGGMLETTWGRVRFTVFYCMGVLFSVAGAFAVWAITGLPAQPTSEYLNLSMFFAYAALYPDQSVMLFFIIPVKVKWLAVIDAAYFAYSILLLLLRGAFVFTLLPVLVAFNVAIMCWDDLGRLRRAVLPRRGGFRPSGGFGAPGERGYGAGSAARPYRHKCEVCGRTDAEYPHLEFRYCSRCEGYHCFCIDHINNHSHFR